MSFLSSSIGAGLKDFLHGHVFSGSIIHGIPTWYSEPKTISRGMALDLVPRSAGLQLPSSHLHSFSTLLFTFTSLTLAPTNSRNFPDSVLSMPNTADESVKYLVPARGNFNASLTFLTSLTELTAATSSILGMVIFTLGATCVFPVTSTHWAVLSSLSHLR
jgi:hypothetical protein